MSRRRRAPVSSGLVRGLAGGAGAAGRASVAAERRSRSRVRAEVRFGVAESFGAAPRLQVVLSRWPQGSAFLQAAEATSLTSIGGACRCLQQKRALMTRAMCSRVGMVLTGVQNLYNTFKEDWSDLQDSLEQLRKERRVDL